MPKNNRTAAVACRRVKTTFGASTLASAILLASGGAHGAAFEFDDFTLDVDSTITYGIQWRAEDRDPTISQGKKGTQQGRELFDLVDMIDNAFVINANDGNLNADKGDIVANRISYLGDIDLNFGSFGVFTRVKAWYDDAWNQNNTSLDAAGYSEYNPNPRFGGSYTAAQGEYNPKARDYMGAQARFLDFFVYAGFDIGDRYLDLRVGRQVISWGESLLSGGGIVMSQNHLDTQIRNTPGLEIKEMFLPTGSVFAQFDLTETLNIQAYYQYEWNKSILDPSSSFYSEMDSVGAGGETFMFISGEEDWIFDQRFNDPDNKYEPNNPNNPPNDANFLQKFIPRDGCDRRIVEGQGYKKEEYKNQYECDFLVSRKYSDEDARDSGQWGVSFQFVMENGDEMGFYYTNYHEKLPTFTLDLDAIDKYSSMIDFLLLLEPPKEYIPGVSPDRCKDFSFDGPDALGGCMSPGEIDLLLSFLGALPFNGGSVEDTMRNLGKYEHRDGRITDFGSAGMLGAADITLKLDGQAAGKDSFVAPLNYKISYAEDIHLWGMSYSTIVGKANVSGEISYRENAPVMRGDIVRTTDREELWHAHVNTIMLFEPNALWDSASLIAEVVAWHIPGRENFNAHDMADFEASKNRLAVQNTANGSGLSLLFMPEYRSVFQGVDLVVTFYTTYGIDGAMFFTGYKNHQGTTALGLTMKYLDAFEAGVSYATMYGDKDDIFQTMTHDRDNYSFNMKYSF